MLERWSDQLDWEKLLNRRSLTWRNVPHDVRDGITKDKAFALMLEQPTLMKRPVLESKQFTEVGFSEKRFADYLRRVDSTA